LQTYKSVVFGLLLLGLCSAGQSQILWLPFEGTGEVAKDVSGNRKDGIIVKATRVPGKYGQGISIGEEDEYVEIPNVLKPEGTLEFWFKPNWQGDTAETYRLFDAASDKIFWFVGKGLTGERIPDFGFFFEDAADTDFIIKTDANVISADTWYHVAATWDFGSGKANFYINGDEAASNGELGKFPELAPKARIGFNAESGYKAADNGADGVIDEFAIYDKVLSADEIKRDMEQLAFPVEPRHRLTTVWGNIKS